MSVSTQPCAPQPPPNGWTSSLKTGDVVPTRHGLDGDRVSDPGRGRLLGLGQQSSRLTPSAPFQVPLDLASGDYKLGFCHTTDGTETCETESGAGHRIVARVTIAAGSPTAPTRPRLRCRQRCACPPPTRRASTSAGPPRPTTSASPATASIAAPLGSAPPVRRTPASPVSPADRISRRRRCVRRRGQQVVARQHDRQHDHVRRHPAPTPRRTSSSACAPRRPSRSRGRRRPTLRASSATGSIVPGPSPRPLRGRRPS